MRYKIIRYTFALIRKHESCSYKKVSIGRYFRQSGFAVDWCSFRLLQTLQPDQDLEAGPGRQKDSGKRGRDWTFPQRSGLERRSKAAEILSATVLPLVIFSSFLVLVCLLLFTDCGSEKGDSSVFLDSIFDIFEDCGLGGSVSQEQQQLIRKLLLNINIPPLTTVTILSPLD